MKKTNRRTILKFIAFAVITVSLDFLITYLYGESDVKFSFFQLIYQGIQGVKGLTVGHIQYAKGKKMLRKLGDRPTYQTPQEMERAAALSMQAAQQGLPQESVDLYTDQMARSQAAAMRSARGRSGGLSALAGIYQSSMDANRNLLAQDAQTRQANLSQALQYQAALAQYKDQEFEMNKMQPYRQGYNEAQAMMGAGIQNIVGGSSQAGAAASAAGTKMMDQNQYNAGQNQADPNQFMQRSNAGEGGGIPQGASSYYGEGAGQADPNSFMMRGDGTNPFGY